MHIVLAAAAGVGTLTTFYTAAAALAAAGTVVALVWGGLKLYHNLLKRGSQFLDDWNGEPERPGVPARQGVMARLHNQDVILADHSETLKHIMHEVNYNSGSTIKDAVHRIDNSLVEVKTQLRSVQTQASQNEAKQEEFRQT